MAFKDRFDKLKSAVEKGAGVAGSAIKSGAKIAAEKGSVAYDKSKVLASEAAAKTKEFAGEAFDHLDEKYKKFKTEDPYVAVKFESDWSDEFDVYGMKVITKGEYGIYLSNIAKQFTDNGSFEWGFGSNQSFTWETLQEFMTTLKIVELTEKQANTLREVLGGSTYGNIPEI